MRQCDLLIFEDTPIYLSFFIFVSAQQIFFQLKQMSIKTFTLTTFGFYLQYRMPTVECKEVRERISTIFDSSTTDVLDITDSQVTITIPKPLCECKALGGRTKKCLFVHGAGQDKVSDIPLDSYEEYWGLKFTLDQLPCCKSIHYTQLDTNQNAWYSPELTQDLSNIALKVSASNNVSSNVLEGMIVYTHSMGNLMFAEALRANRCQLGDDSKWVSIMGPMDGSKAVDDLVERCDAPDEEANWASKVKFNAIKMGLKKSGRCPVKPAYRALVSSTGKYSSANLTKSFNEIQQVMKEQASGVLCGRTSIGILSEDSHGLAIVSLLTGLEDESVGDGDGVQSVSSCIGDLNLRDFDDDPYSQYYLADINHYDGTMKNGEGSDITQKPLTWLKCLFRD